jgi:hypothetical protein
MTLTASTGVRSIQLMPQEARMHGVLHYAAACRPDALVAAAHIAMAQSSPSPSYDVRAAYSEGGHNDTPRARRGEGSDLD